MRVRRNEDQVRRKSRVRFLRCKLICREVVSRDRSLFWRENIAKFDAKSAFDILCPNCGAGENGEAQREKGHFHGCTSFVEFCGAYRSGPSNTTSRRIRSSRDSENPKGHVTWTPIPHHQLIQTVQHVRKFPGFT